LCGQLKELQRQDPAAKEQWVEYCNAMGNGMRDPSKHDAMFVETFIVNFNAGMRFESNDRQQGGGGLASKEIIELVKVGQRKAPSWRQAWAHYCHIYGNNKNDPTKHSEVFLGEFIDFVSQRALQSLTTGINLDATAAVSGNVGIMGSVSTANDIAAQLKAEQARVEASLANLQQTAGMDMQAMQMQQQQQANHRTSMQLIPSMPTHRSFCSNSSSWSSCSCSSSRCIYTCRSLPSKPSNLMRRGRDSNRAFALLLTRRNYWSLALKHSSALARRPRINGGHMLTVSFEASVIQLDMTPTHCNSSSTPIM